LFICIEYQRITHAIADLGKQLTVPANITFDKNLYT
jgi:hypothetical protein